MEFERSTQAQSWMFSGESLRQCKERSSTVLSIANPTSTTAKPKVRKFACGFQQRRSRQQHEGISSRSSDSLSSSHGSIKMTTSDQDILVHFHSHQIQRLVGPNAIFPELRRSTSVLSTAIMLFRRFYLSNSVVDFHPRNIAAASALLAVKVDCERRLEIGILSHATNVVNMKAKKAALCRDELKAVCVEEIEEAERNLLGGLDFRLRCHHPYGAIQVLSGEVIASVEDLATYGTGNYHSLQDFHHENYSRQHLATLCERALAVAQSALVYSDVNFLFPPGKIAFASVAIALEGQVWGKQLGTMMRRYLRARFPQKAEEELLAFEQDVLDIVYELECCPEIDLRKFSSAVPQRHSGSAQVQAAEVRRVFAVANHLRHLCCSNTVPPPTVLSCSGNRKRHREESPYFAPYVAKVARVTPTQTPFY
eukprot:Nitzschia sp. Nitz4//scaffold156_size52432//23037//24550//NITZ4_006826-RA/size52432-snap-gene-0.11-mRNA-1//1//CDS//3329537412//9036//frame0